MSGLLTLGQRSTSSAARPDAMVGWVIADYNWGSTQFTAMKAYFEAIGRPQQFQPEFKSLSVAFDDADTSSLILGMLNSDKMKTVGERSVDFRKRLEAWAVAQGMAAPTPSSASDKAPPSSGLIPWWAWTIIVAGSLGAFAIFAVPPIVSAVAAARAARKVL